jgi:hypothetical protein
LEGRHRDQLLWYFLTYSERSIPEMDKFPQSEKLGKESYDKAIFLDPLSAGWSFPKYLMILSVNFDQWRKITSQRHLIFYFYMLS